MSKKALLEERPMRASSGMVALIGNLFLMIASLPVAVMAIISLESGRGGTGAVVVVVLASLWLVLIGPILFAGLKVLRPNEALVLTLFGEYKGTLTGPGFFFVNPFVSAATPAKAKPSTGSTGGEKDNSIIVGGMTFNAGGEISGQHRKISLKALTLSNDKQKINDAQGNPIVIGIVVVWKVVNAAKAVFNVDNYTEYLSIQCDSALRNIVRLYPYDSDEDEKSLRGSSTEIAEKLKIEIQANVHLAGLEILEARITHLSYAPEIAAAMLQRQQAGAIVAARQLIVEGAVGMVEMALARLSAQKIVDLDEERKATMVSNLLVVLCANKEVQPVVNSGSIY